MRWVVTFFDGLIGKSSIHYSELSALEVASNLTGRTISFLPITAIKIGEKIVLEGGKWIKVIKQ